MAYEVELPNGQVAEFPDEMSQEQIQSVLRKQFPTTNNVQNKNIQQNVSPKDDLEHMMNIFNAPLSQRQGEAFQNVPVGIAKGIANFPEEVANIFGKHLYNKFSPSNEYQQSGQLASDIATFGLPSGIGKGIVKGLSYFQPISNALKAAVTGLESRPILNALAKLGKGAGETSFFAARKAKPEEINEEAAKGAGLGAGLSAVSQLAGSRFPLISRLGMAGVGAGMGSMVGHPYEGALAGLTIGPKLRGSIGGLKETQLAEESLQGLSPEKVKKAVEANKRLNTIITPGQAAGSYTITGKEGRLRRKTGMLGEELEKEQITSQNKAVNKLLNDIYKPTKENENKINSLYEKAYNVNLKPNVLNDIKQNELIGQSFNNVKRLTKLQNVPENNYEFLHQVDRDLRRRWRGELNSNEKYYIGEVQKEFNTFLKEQNPYYQKASQAAQPKIVRENLESKMNVLEENLTAKNLYKSLIGNRRKYSESLRELKNFPEARKQLVDMRHGWKDFTNIKTTSQSEAQGKSAIDQARSVLSAVDEFLGSTFAKKANEQRLRYIHSKKWPKGFELIKKAQTERERNKQLLDMVRQIGSAYYLSKNETNNLEHLITSKESE